MYCPALPVVKVSLYRRELEIQRIHKIFSALVEVLVSYIRYMMILYDSLKAILFVEEKFTNF